MSAGHILGVQVAHLTAHIAREQILVAADFNRLLAHHLAQLVVLTCRRHKQAHCVGIAALEHCRKFVTHSLAHLARNHRGT